MRRKTKPRAKENQTRYVLGSPEVSGPTDSLLSIQMQIKMAAEMSLRADEERRRKLELQEEQDLAYAIALSKAEAASLK